MENAYALLKWLLSIKKTILDELDLNREGANAIQLKRNFEQGSEYDKVLYVPEIYSEYSHKNVLVMERIYGIGVGEIGTLNSLGVDMKLLAERGVEVFFTQVFRDSFFSCRYASWQCFCQCD